MPPQVRLEPAPALQWVLACTDDGGQWEGEGAPLVGLSPHLARLLSRLLSCDEIPRRDFASAAASATTDAHLEHLDGGGHSSQRVAAAARQRGGAGAAGQREVCRRQVQADFDPRRVPAPEIGPWQCFSRSISPDTPLL